MTHDVIVVGLGAAGSAAAFQLARRGVRVLGFDPLDPPHAHGSSHGETRITRQAIGEGDAYVPLVLRSNEIFHEVERLAGVSLLTQTGGLWISSPARQAETHVANFFDNTLAAARRFGIEHEVLDAAAIRGRFPQFDVRDNEVGYYERGAGFLRPEACVAAQLGLARKHGAEIHTGERVVRITGSGVVTDRATYFAGRVILCVGAWIRRFLPPERAREFRVTRQVQYWYEVRGPIDAFEAPRFPCWIWELQERHNVIYGFPAIDGPTGGLKLATETYRVELSEGEIDAARGEVSEAEKRGMHETLVAPYLPALGPRCIRAAACLYTATPDFHFLIDRHPELDNTIVASPCSGHGFKHSAAVGEILADLATEGATRFDIAPFRWR